MNILVTGGAGFIGMIGDKIFKIEYKNDGNEARGE